MMISKRQYLLIEQLKDKKIMTATVIAQNLGVSTKTVRNDISQINQEYGTAVIQSVASKGYFLSSQSLVQQQDIVNKKSENLMFEILKCIINQDQNDCFELAERFFISDSTLNRILNEINLVIAEKNESLCIIRKNNNLMIEAQEEEKRQLFNFFLNKEIETYRLNLSEYENYFEFCDLNRLSKLIVSYHKSKNYQLNDFATVSFILHIAVLLDRTIKGSHIQAITQEGYDQYSIQLAEDLILLLKETFLIQIPNEEIFYVAQMYSKKATNPTTIGNYDFDMVVTELFDYITLSFGIDFSEDDKMKPYLLNHLTLLYQRASYKQYLSNPLTEELKSKFPFIYNVSVCAAAWLQKRLKLSFPDDEIAYIALHFLSASETITHRKKRSVLLVSPYGVGSQHLVINQLKKILDYSINVVTTASVFDVVDHLNTSEFDLILTAEYLEVTTTIPIYQYYLLLTEDDLNQIQILFSSSIKSESVTQRYFKEELFFSKKQFKTPEEVICYLCRKLCDLDYCDREYTEKVLAREKLSSTSYGNYYAIPHAIQRCAKKNAVAVCSLEKPINWGGKKVKLVLLLALKEQRDSSFELLFEQLVSLLSESNIVNKLAKETDFPRFIQICEKK